MNPASLTPPRSLDRTDPLQTSRQQAAGRSRPETAQSVTWRAHNPTVAGAQCGASRVSGSRPLGSTVASVSRCPRMRTLTGCPRQRSRACSSSTGGDESDPRRASAGDREGSGQSPTPSCDVTSATRDSEWLRSLTSWGSSPRQLTGVP
jgi:hypothetical protein